MGNVMGWGSRNQKVKLLRPSHLLSSPLWIDSAEIEEFWKAGARPIAP
jgi:hypothetical protein